MIRETKEAFYKVAFLPWLVPTYLPSKLQALPHVTKGSHKNEGMKVVLLAGGLVVKIVGSSPRSPELNSNFF